MAAAKEQRRLDFERSQNIALLSLLTKNPSPVEIRSCPVHISNHDLNGRTLSFSRESHLVEALAFISGVSDSSDHVVALCVEELPSRSGLRVAIAVNRSAYANPSDTRLLSRIKTGLESIFHLLARESRKHDPVLEEQILDAIIHLSRHRIFSRIKSTRKDASYSKKGKDSARTKLRRIVTVARVYTFTSALVREDVESFIRHAEQLLDAVMEVETIDSGLLHKSLKRLVVTACFLHRDIKILSSDHILDQLETSPELLPNDINWFRRITKKLARYRECSAYLFRRAQDNHLFRNVIVTAISPPAELFNHNEYVLDEQCLANCILRARNGAATDTFKARARVAALRELGNAGFLRALKSIFKEFRIHAEIQIAAHYELHPAKIPPRVIKSSKDACYLCHLFLEKHGKFHTSRTHGRLYPAWRLPNTAVFNKVQKKLNTSLEARIWQESQEYMETRMAKDAIQVNESEVGSLSSMSTLSSFGLLTATAGPSKPNQGHGAVVRGIDESATSQNRLAGNSSPTQPVVTREEPEQIVSLDEPTAHISESSQDEEHQPGTMSPPQEHIVAHHSLEPIPESDHEPSEPETINIAPLSTDVMRENQTSVSDPRPDSSAEDTGQGQDEAVQQAEDEPSAPEASIEPESDSRSISEHDLVLQSEAQVPESTSQTEVEPRPWQEVELKPENNSRITPTNGSPSSSQTNLVSLEPELNPGTSTSQISLLSPIPSDLEEQESDLSEQDDDFEIILVQGQTFTVRLDGNRNFPPCRLGKSGKLTIHPHYVMAKNESSNKRGIAEMSMTWLLSTSSPAPSLAAGARDRRRPGDTDAERGHEHDQGGGRADRMNRHPGRLNGHMHKKSVDGVPEYHVGALPTREELDAASKERVRLVGQDGEVVLIEVLRT
ncbi:hypothetical protein QBC37DRAFT_106675 [Rhypophila decipiens]|uniref:Uncharacterized protein n=1 Tax=Rhypophila decipiens TaxID=261697 RepID=A0AAN6YCF6_9PEZI|nr:hypothetical protein QBC37DRAFT_106675 [Rhypophila decipiens]